MNKRMKAVGAVETVLGFPRSLWARCPPEVDTGKASTAPAASTAPQRLAYLAWASDILYAGRALSRDQEMKRMRRAVAASTAL